MENKQQKGRQMRFTEDELDLIRATYKDNEKLLKLLRKVFLPEIDPEAPLGEMIDLWMGIKTNEDMSDEQVATQVRVRNMLINHVDQMLMQLEALSLLPKGLTWAEYIEQQKKNSSK